MTSLNTILKMNLFPMTFERPKFRFDGFDELGGVLLFESNTMRHFIFNKREKK